MPALRAPLALVLAGTLWLAGCTRVGPDFQSPREPWVEHWNSPALEQISRHRPQPAADLVDVEGLLGHEDLDGVTEQLRELLVRTRLERAQPESPPHDGHNGGSGVSGMRSSVHGRAPHPSQQRSVQIDP